MTYGYRDRASAASAAAVQRALDRASGTWGGYRAVWPAVAQKSVVAEKTPKPAPNRTPAPANDLTLADPLIEQLELKKGCIGNGS
jgi:hypothetical protein